jgi:DNA-binding MarR family transcriptional regulator
VQTTSSSGPTNHAAGAPDLATRLRLAVTRTARRLRQEGTVGFSPSQGAMLATIERHGPLTPSELAQRERVQRPTVTRMLAKLEEDGIVQRAADPADGRSFLVSLTPAGLELLHEVRTRKDAYLAQRLQELSDEERAALDRAADVLERLLEGDRA